MARFFSATGEQGGNRLSSHFKHVSVIRESITVRGDWPHAKPPTWNDSPEAVFRLASHP